MGLVIRSTSVRTPIVPLELKPRDQKVIAVALAALVFFGLQWGLSLPMALGISLLLSTATYFSEKHFRTEKDGWFETSFDKKMVALVAALLILRPILLQLFFSVLGIPLPLPQAGVAKLILAFPKVMVPLATIIAPLVEEILFRGFLMERLEDITQSKEISNALQAMAFGAIHLTAKINKGWKLPVFLTLSAMGYILGVGKQKYRSLLPAISWHSANNTGYVASLFIRI